MASIVQRKFDTEGTFTITLAGLGHSVAGAGRQSTLLTNSDNRPGALVSVKVTSNGAAAPTANSVVAVYLIRDTGTLVDDNAGPSDAALTVENSPMLGTIVFTATTAKAFVGIFSTEFLGPLGPNWGIALVNVTGQALHATEANHACHFRYFYDEAQ